MLAIFGVWDPATWLQFSKINSAGLSKSKMIFETQDNKNARIWYAARMLKIA